MIARQYGSKIQSVQANFDARAMNEIGFRRDNEWSEETDEFLGAWEKVETHELDAEAEGTVHGEAEEELLRRLRARLQEIEDAASDGMIVIENEGLDYPKTRSTQTTQVVGNENRLYFRFTISPPLRVAVYRKR